MSHNKSRVGVLQKNKDSTSLIIIHHFFKSPTAFPGKVYGKVRQRSEGCIILSQLVAHSSLLHDRVFTANELTIVPPGQGRHLGG